ncbi:MAG TPA: hypothetical protein VHC86_00675 [Opitutaceae bacterium]|nr:hypothetical protein [Opitutaceae bacterium]HZY71849.1 hypothetical protein [Edaphobacter sp.]
MDSPIPAEWRQPVCRILSSCSLSGVEIRQRARRDWQALFPGAFDSEIFDAFLKALRNPMQTGRLVTTMAEPGTVYEFIFEHEGRQIYGKVNLLPSGQVIIIYSAHRPLKGETL